MISKQLYIFLKNNLNYYDAYRFYYNKITPKHIRDIKGLLELNINQIPNELSRECFELLNNFNNDLFISEATNMNKILIDINDIDDYDYKNRLKAVISDTHITKYSDLDILYNAYKYCASKDIRTMLHLGDVLNKNNKINIMTFIDFMKTIENDFKELITYFIPGDHDNYIKNNLYLRELKNFKVYNCNREFKEGHINKKIILTHTNDKEIEKLVNKNRDIIYLNGHTHTPETKLVAESNYSKGISFPACNALETKKNASHEALLSLLSFEIIDKALSQFTVYEINANENSEKLKNKALMKTYKF